MLAAEAKSQPLPLLLVPTSNEVLIIVRDAAKWTMLNTKKENGIKSGKVLCHNEGIFTSISF